MPSPSTGKIIKPMMPFANDSFVVKPEDPTTSPSTPESRYPPPMARPHLGIPSCISRSIRDVPVAARGSGFPVISLIHEE
ncbi:uncharacterized protein BP01DRAFT_146371 [Aspergillus saccharolyticus JOP 1030-1]|uniref:Uncharacterized protein n=1 Tax=Aspergillus saccharolyticus JOP 1030-1 TaxID=1450539 RepID=A0A319A9J4_9EURO|nr:hypothetical protein BP01DRAFT_146371 [Aspergillus saccharolyticus JOP 1030-1]PYH48368.1 hypothetical protein BP01DRAFT_146371 [Aspergillus saccharolyticus JOP 1030-1]